MITTLSDPELMRTHVHTMYTHDINQRIVTINDGLEGDAPRFWFGSTRTENLWRFRHDLSEDLIAALEELCKSEPVLGEQPSQSPVHQEKYIRLLESHYPVEELVAGPTYWFKEEVESIGSSIEINSSNINLLKNGLEAWIPAVPHYRPFMASLEDGQAVSVCSSVRITEEAHAAGVETLADYRHRGHATGVVRSWAREVQKSGAIAFYSTSWSNNASQSVAARLGLSFFGTEFRLA